MVRDEDTKRGSYGLTKGNMVTEFLFWLFFLLPGLLYSLWRISSRYWGCPKCGAANMIPPNSPVAQKILSKI
jgi:hypothetical protein